MKIGLTLPNRGVMFTWTASGSPAECAETLQELGELGFSEITLRITSWDQETQFRKLIGEVLPRLTPTAVR